ncbi:MAG: flagellar biosynthesis protein FlhB [Bryobacteraceae bacterium]|nr:MAG: flagellar biosynthesis protein FlhB [Bryobacteraceae bacterium]
MADRDQRTEAPTPQRIRKARQEGRFVTSREMVFAALFLGWVLLLHATGLWMQPALHGFGRLLRAAFQPDTVIEALRFLPQATAGEAAMVFLVPSLGLAMLGLLAHLAITGFGFAPSKVTPDFSRLNPGSHLRDLPRKNMDQLVAAALMLPLVAGVGWLVVRSRWEEFLRLPLLSLDRGAAVVAGAISDLLWKAAALFLVWGAFDLFRQRRRYLRDLRMTKQEVREEYRQNEGSPEVKARIRRLRRELLRRRMMSEIPKASVVVVNPTHYAVALRYDRHSMAAPRVVAKGRNYLAQRIRQKAIEHHVPVVENPPLARALYRQVEVGREIPVELYRAVAEVLAYVFRLMQSNGPGNRS